MSAPDATTCAAGTARPIAHGQVMMSTAMAITSDSCHPAPAIIQPANASAARVWTAGA